MTSLFKNLHPIKTVKTDRMISERVSFVLHIYVDMKPCVFKCVGIPAHYWVSVEFEACPSLVHARAGS